MNIAKLFFSILLLVGISISVEPTMAFLFTKNLTSDEFVQFVQEKQQDKSGTIELTRFEIKGFDFPFKTLKDIHFKDTTWSDIEAKGRVFDNVTFEDCKLDNLNFRETTLKGVVFRNCTLTNVVMNKSKIDKIVFEDSKLVSTDSNIEHSYREMDADTLIFKNSDLTNINFFESKGQFHFEDGKLLDVSGMGLQEGSALYFQSTHADDIDFGDSTLSTLEVKNSTIKQSKANNCRIGTVLLEDSDLDFPIADGKGYGKVIARNTKNVIIGGTPVKDVIISGCDRSLDIDIGTLQFENISVDNCSVTNFIFYESVGKEMTISNVKTSRFDLEDANIEHLILKNIHIRGDLQYGDAKIGKLEAKNITFDSDIKIESKGANFELKADVIRPVDD